MFAFLSLCFAAINALDCNVLDYGAVGDGKTDDTKAIQKAFDSCNLDNGQWNVILFPKNYNFFSYPVTFNNGNLEIIIDSKITMSPNITAWPSPGHREPWLSNKIYNIKNVVLHGKGIVNGNGMPWWNSYLNGSIEIGDRPRIIAVNNITNITIYDITLIDSPKNYLFINYCVDVVVHNINITGPPFNIAPETDGIDLGSRNVHVYDSYIQSGDDSYEIKWWSKNVTIENSIAGGGLGLDVGTTAEPIIQDVTFRNMICRDTWWGIRLKQQSFMNGTVRNLKYINITFENVSRGIDINDFNQTVYDGNVGFVNVTDILFQDIHGTYTLWAGELDCDASLPCTNLKFENINLKFTGNGTDQGFSCSDSVYGSAVNVSPPLTCLKSD